MTGIAVANHLPKSDVSGLSGTELTAYLTLLNRGPLNGSQVSRYSGVTRANAYDALRSLKLKDFVIENEDGLFAPLPSEEFLKRIRQRCNLELSALEEKVASAGNESSYEYIWTLRGYDEVMAKAKSMIAAAGTDLYVCFYPTEAERLDPELIKAVQRGVSVKYVSMGEPINKFDRQVIHHNSDSIRMNNKGRVFDLVRDKSEVLVGVFRTEDVDDSPINWAQSNWFVHSVRESVRHDFFHCLMHKIFTRGEKLSPEEIEMYHHLENDAWGSEASGREGNDSGEYIKSSDNNTEENGS